MAPHALIKAIEAQSPDLTMISATSWIPLFKSEPWLMVLGRLRRFSASFSKLVGRR